MKIISKDTCSILLLLLLGNTAPAQDINIYRSGEAVMAKMNGATTIENRIEKVILVSANNSKKFRADLELPYHSINNAFNDSDVVQPSGYSLQLCYTIDPAVIQEYLTSSKTFTTHASMTLNSITKTVTVKYMPLPAGPDEDGDFNISLILQFDPAEFQLAAPGSHELYVIRIIDQHVDRV